MENLIHIVFEKEGAGNLKKSFYIDDIISGDILTFEDDLAFGTLQDLSVEGHVLSRNDWWQKITAPEAYTAVNHDHELLEDLCQKMREDENNEIWIWAGQNSRDVCGYYSLLQSLSDFKGRVYIIYLNNLPFINDKGGIFYPSGLSEILPKEFLKARKLAREITAAEMEVDREEWNKIKEENAVVRILEGGKKITGKADDFFDNELISRCRSEFVKGWRLINQIRQKDKDHVNEAYLYFRLNILLENGTLVSKGDFKQIRDAEIKAAGSEPTENIVEENKEGENNG